MHATAKSTSKDDGGDVTESKSGSDGGDQRKHSALTCQGKVPCKDLRKGVEGKN